VFLDFGLQPHSDGFIRAEHLTRPEAVFPLATALCNSCGQVQLTYSVSPSALWDEGYVYDSSTTQTGRTHFLTMAAKIVESYALPEGALAVDIGSNVGVLLSGFQEKGLRVLGIDPAPVPSEIARKNGIDTLTKLFTADTARSIVAKEGKAAVITATNVFAHIDDLDDVMKGIDTLLDDRGMFVIEAPYLGDLVENMEYDTIYHQHVSYLSIAPLVQFFQRFGMELFDIVRTSIHGGSVRLFVCRTGVHKTRPIVHGMIEAEQETGLQTLKKLTAFSRNVQLHRAALVEMLMSLKDQGKSIAGLSAPAKGNTLLNFCGINGSILDFITEKNPLKVGLLTPGSRIPIVGDAVLVERRPDYALVLAWNFAEEIIRNLSAYAALGGKFIVPIPSPVIR
jgi:SAM-dependent methyltransferase